MPSIVGKQERASCNKQMLILSDSLTWFGLNVATFAEASEVQCWITSCNVQLFLLASKLMPKLTEKLPAKLSSDV